MAGPTAGETAAPHDTDAPRRRAQRRSPRAAPGPAKPGLAARHAALAFLSRVAEGDALPDDGVESSGGPAGSLAPEDRARARRLALAALRHRGRSRALQRRYLTGSTPESVRRLLDLATVEMLAEGAPAHAVVDAAVTLARSDSRLRRQSGLVNAVLRRIAEDGPALWAALQTPRLPAPLRRVLLSDWGPRTVGAIEAAHEAGAPLDLTLRDPGTAAALAARLGAVRLPTGSLRLSGAPQVSTLPGYAAGEFWVQDAAAALPARILAPAPGARVLDLCAAPGGKTMQLAASGAEVTALDLSEARLGRLHDNLARTGLSAGIVAADAFDWTPPAPFDAILLDAPCTATGTIRRHPDLPLRARPEGLADRLAELTHLQAALIDRALGWLAPGGRLVYATCSLLRAEGEDQLAAALARWPGLAVADDPLPAGVPEAWRAAGGGLRTRPDFWSSRGGLDGFFMVCLVRPRD